MKCEFCRKPLEIHAYSYIVSPDAAECVYRDRWPYRLKAAVLAALLIWGWRVVRAYWGAP